MIKHILIITLLVFTQLQASAQLFKEELRISLAEEFKEKEVQSILLCMAFFENELRTFFNLSVDSDEDPLAMYIEYTEDNYLEFEIPVNFAAQQELYQKLNTYFFSRTWGYGLLTRGEDQTTYISLNLKTNSPLLKHLRKRSRKIKVITDYLNTLEAAGDISPSMVGTMASFIPQEYQKTLELRILLTFHYLTLNDSIKRRDRM